MCSHYEAPSPHQVAEAFGVELFDQGRLDFGQATSAHSCAAQTAGQVTTILLQPWKC